MDSRPTLITKRLKLRPFYIEDAPEVQLLAGDMEIARNAINIPHPYEDGIAERWIITHLEEFDDGKSVIFAITLKEDGKLIGAIGLIINEKHNHAELGYWIGKQYWNNGYCKEAVKEVIKYGFEDLGFNKIFANHLEKNTASGKILIKNRMKQEGILRRHLYSFDKYENLVCYGILKSEYKTS